MMTIARTGSGKGRSCLIPWLLHLANPAIVLDVKGEAFHCTARYRREVLGHRIVTLDPFGICGGTDAINPFDLVRKEHVETDADAVIELLIDGKPTSSKEPFWDLISRAFLLGCVAHITSTAENAHPTQLRDLLQCDDVVYEIAKLLDSKAVTNKLAYREFTTFLQHEKDKVRPSVLSTAQQHLRVLAAESVANSLSHSTISLEDVIRGDNFTIYLVIPPEKLASHGTVLRMWVGTLLHALSRRTKLPEHNTLFLLDEIAQCGTLPALRQAITLLRGYGVSTITMWQDLDQLQSLYPDWRTLLNNCALLQTFGAATFEMARTMADVIGVSPERILGMPADNSLISAAGGDPFEVRRLDYLTDTMFAGRSSPNPMFCDRDSGKRSR